MLSHVALHHHMKTFSQWHQFLHVLIRTHRVSFEVLCHKEWISAWNSDQQRRFILINKFFQQILIDGLQTVPSTNLKYGQIHHNLRIKFWHSSRSSSPILHSSRCSGYFSKFSNLSHPSRPSDYFSKFSLEGVETCQFSTNSFNSLLFRSPTSSPRCQANTSPM